jgi:LCP family protein required for cell wall assembly
MHSVSLRAFGRRLVIALVISSSLMASAVVAVNEVIDQKIASIPRIKVTTAPPPPAGANYVLLGSDTRSFVNNATQRSAFGDASTSSGPGNSDTLMVIHVEPSAKRTLIVSFPRDLWVDIAGHGMAKINAAYNYGPQTVVDTFKQDFNVDINHYIELDFESFREIVDAIGHVPIYFPYPAKDEKTGLHFFVGGCLPLNGTEALEYARSRYLQYYNPLTRRWFSPDPIPDIGRIARQQEFIRKLAGIAVHESLSNPFTANAVANNVLKYLTVDQGLSKQDIFSLIDVFRTVDVNDTSHLDFETLPWHGGPNQAGGQQVLYVDNAAAAPLLNRLRDFTGSVLPAPSPAGVRVRVVNRSGRAGVGQATLRDLERLGFGAAGASDDLSHRAAQTEVRYAGQDTRASLVLQYLGPTARLVADPRLPSGAVEIVLGTDFESIVKPAGTASPATGTTPGGAPPTSAPAPAPNAAAPIAPGAAPRGSC